MSIIVLYLPHVFKERSENTGMLNQILLLKSSHSIIPIESLHMHSVVHESGKGRTIPPSTVDSQQSVVVYPLPWPLLVGGVRCSRLWSTSQLLRPSGQQCSHSGGVCPHIQGRQCGACVGAVEEMMCVVCVDVTEGA